MARECERTAIMDLTQEDIFSQPDGLFHCPTCGCTAVFSYSRDRGGLQLVEGVKRCDEVNAEIAELGRILEGNNPFKIRPEDRLTLVFRYMDLQNEADDMGVDKY